MPDTNYDLQVMLTCGTEDPERATLGLAAALASASSGQSVVIFFTIRGVEWIAPTTPDHDEILGFPRVSEMLEMLIELDVRMEGCTSCVDNHLVSEVGESGHRIMAPSFTYGGLSKAALRIGETPTVTF